MRVLVADDDPQILKALRIILGAHGYDVSLARNGREAIDVAAHDRPDVIVLDLGMPGVGGVEVIEAVRGWTTTPILVVSGRSDTAGKVDALDAGADDYVTKPFGMEELLARIRAATRRAGADGVADTPTVSLGDVTVDFAARQVHGFDADGSPRQIRLTPTEWQLMEVFGRHPGKLLDQRYLVAQVWGPASGHQLPNLRLYLSQLRRKLEPHPARPRYLVTEPGMGYRFQPGR